MTTPLWPHQTKALSELDDGKILVGGTGSGKSRTALAYYVQAHLGKDLLIITTAKKRDSLEWEEDLATFALSTNAECSRDGIKVYIDSWNNITKHTDVNNTFVILDEQRLVGYGAWVAAFLKISRKNPWLLLSATPADQWMDLLPVFIAHGFFKNKREFEELHVRYDRYSKYPKIDRYIYTERLEQYRSQLYVEMPFERHTTRIREYENCEYDRALFKSIWKERWNPYLNKPIKNRSQMFVLAKRIVYSDQSRYEATKRFVEGRDRTIVFYNFNYELDILRNLEKDLEIEVKEWNGQKHEPVPTSKQWVYLVQYQSGSEAWNCVSTDSMLFSSLNYSYRITTQAEGRIDRLNTKYQNLYYHYLTSTSPVDLLVRRSHNLKKDFNERSIKF